MRFHLTTHGGPIEVLGDLVELPNSGAEQFFVHHAAVRSERDDDLDDDELPLFAVSHVGTGFRVGAGNTIDEAISHARIVMNSKTPKEVALAIKRAKARIQEMGGDA